MNGIRLDAKLNVYRVGVLPTLLYESYTNARHGQHTNFIPRDLLAEENSYIMIWWQDKIPDTEILKKAGIKA